MKTPLYKSLILVAVVALSTVVPGVHAKEPAPGWLMNVENPLSSTGDQCSGALLHPRWVVTTKECAMQSLVIKWLSNNSEIPEQSTVERIEFQDDIALIKLSREVDQAPAKILPYDPSCTGWTCQYLLRQYPEVSFKPVALKWIHSLVHPIDTVTCDQAFPHNSHERKKHSVTPGDEMFFKVNSILCTIPGTDIPDSDIRGAALVHPSKGLVGLGRIDSYTNDSGMTPGYMTFIDLAPYQRFISDTVHRDEHQGEL